MPNGLRNIQDCNEFTGCVNARVVFNVNFSRLLALSTEELVMNVPDYAMDIITARSVFEKTVNVICCDPQRTVAVVPMIPEAIDFVSCRGLEAIETRRNVLVRLVGEKPERETLYQTPIDKEMWHGNKFMLLAASHKLTECFALKTSIREKMGL